MTSFPGASPSLIGGVDQLVSVGRSDTIDAPPGVAPGELPVSASGGHVSNPLPVLGAAIPGEVTDTDPTDSWYEIVHVFPLRVDAGNVLTTVTTDVEVYNAFRDASVSWSSLVQNAGAGINVTGTTPPPTVSMPPSSGVPLTLEITPNGPAIINGSLDFVFTGLYTISVFITGSRLVLFPFAPESPLRERLRFLTNILESEDGGEQRIALRGFPRQEFVMDLVREEGAELTRFDNTVFDWQARVFGFPLWYEQTLTTADSTSGATTVSVSSTAYADYRVGGLAAVYISETEFDVLEVTAFDATSVTFDSPTTMDYPAGTVVMPVRTCRMTPQVTGARARVGSGSRRVVMRCTDNDVGDAFADATPFATYEGSVLLDDPNAVDGNLRESIDRRFLEQDASTGTFDVETPWSQPKRGSAKGFRPKSRRALWETRRLLHFLRGRQVSFWMPTFYKDLVPVEIVLGGSTNLVIEAAGFAQFVQTTRPNRSVIRLETVSGSEQIRVIRATGSLTQGRESVTVTSAWDAGNIDPSDIARITFFERVRLASDDIDIVHINNAGQADISAPVIAVFDS